MKIKELIIWGMASMSLASCHSLDLQPLTQASTGNWFSDETQLDMSLNTLYMHRFWPMFKNDFYVNGSNLSLMALDEATDDWTNRTTLIPFTNGALTGDNVTFLKQMWSYSYKAVSRCNTILENMHRAADKMSFEKYKRYEAEALFVRACQYARLVSYWGDVVYFTKDLDLDEAYKLGRTGKDEVMKVIYADFDTAAKYLPVSYTSGEVQRATKGAAYAMKARAALFNKDYEIALKAAQDCMELGVYQLYPDFGELFMSKTKNSVETVFGIPRSTKYGTSLEGGAVTAYLSRNITSPSCTATPSWDLLCAFLCTDGKTIDKSPLYDPRNPFKNRDPRCSYTIVEFNTRYFDYNYTVHPDSSKCYNYKTGTLVANKDSKAGDQYASYNGLILRKGIDEDWGDDLKADNDKLIVRYADVLLMYAEAKIELNRIDASVLEAMNKVRARAYKKDWNSEGYPRITTTDQTELRRLLRIERRMEFAFEGLRYADIIRWRIAEKVMNYYNYGIPTSLADCKTLVHNNYWFFGGTPEIDEDGCPDFTKMDHIDLYRKLSKRVFDPGKHYLWPLPTDDLTVNPNLLPNNPNY